MRESKPGVGNARSLSGQNALVTGASSGIGAGVARALPAAGMALYPEFARGG